jgi:CRISPR-associated protein Csd1
LIIQALCRHYDLLASDSGSSIPLNGFSIEKVNYEITLSPNGEIVGLIDLCVFDGKKVIPTSLVVPIHAKRSSGILPFFLCEKGDYVFGRGSKDSDRLNRQNHAFKDLHERILSTVDDPGAFAMLQFIRSWSSENVEKTSALSSLDSEELEKSVFVFRMEGDPAFLHQHPAIQKAWLASLADKHEGQKSQCLITGEDTYIKSVHDPIKGVKGAQTSGAAIVSFNFPSVISYGKAQSSNAPIGEESAFKYVTTLNWLLASRRNRMQIGDATTVFWAESPEYEDLLGEFLDPSGRGDEVEGKRIIDAATREQVFSILDSLRRGHSLSDKSIFRNPDTNVHIVGLAPNSARISIRFYHQDTLGSSIERIAQHYLDLELERPTWMSETSLPGPYVLLRAIAPQHDLEKLPETMVGPFMLSILTGAPYPSSLMAQVILRIRANDGIKTRDGKGMRSPIEFERVCIIKATLLRNARRTGNRELEVNCTVSLNQESTNTPYRLGRLFAALEKAQMDANPSINSTIRDRYFSSAFAAPASTFPILLKLSQHHIAKGEHGGFYDRMVRDIVSDIDIFPSHLDLNDQGLFILGYYHQTEAFYKKTESKEGAQT